MRIGRLVVLFFLPLSLVLAADPAINVTLEGKWSGDAKDGTKISYEFTKDGSITWFVEEPEFTKTFPKGLKGKYKVRVADPTWQIDITGFEHPQFQPFKFLGLIAIIDDKSFRMEGLPGQRPKRFGDEAIVFKAAPK